MKKKKKNLGFSLENHHNLEWFKNGVIFEALELSLYRTQLGGMNKGEVVFSRWKLPSDCENLGCFFKMLLEITFTLIRIN